MIKEYPVEYREFEINDLWERSRSGTLVLRPDFQRTEVWSLSKKQKLIDSILRRFTIGLLYFREKEKQIKKGRYELILECLDGQQRLRAIFDFMEDRFRINPNITTELEQPKKFSELSENLKAKIRMTPIKAVVVRSDDDEMISEIFMRLQEGVPLRAAEKLNALRGDLRNQLVELSQHKALKLTTISEYRFQHRYLVAQLALLEFDGRYPENLPQNIGFKELKKMYETYKSGRLSEVKRICGKIKRNLHFIRKVMRKDLQLIRHRGDFLAFYVFLSHLHDEYAVKNKEEILRSYLADFLTKVEGATKEQKDDFATFKALRRRATERGDALREAVKILFENFFSRYRDIEWKKKDPQRLFSWAQRVAIYRIQKGKCKKCGKPLDIREAHFHHKIPWEEGGKTTVENGEMYCPEHHPR